MADILVVDDDRDYRRTLCRLFEAEGHTTAEASDGCAALALLQVMWGPYIVILDHRMPRMDGCTFLEHVVAAHAGEETIGPRFILCSASDPAMLRSRYAALANRVRLAFVRKPYDADELLELVGAPAARRAS